MRVDVDVSVCVPVAGRSSCRYAGYCSSLLIRVATLWVVVSLGVALCVSWLVVMSLVKMTCRRILECSVGSGRLVSDRCVLCLTTAASMCWPTMKVVWSSGWNIRVLWTSEITLESV